MRKLLALILLGFGVCPVALSETLPISLDYYGQSGLSAVFRTRVDEATIGSITGVVIADTNQQTGSSGVFSGFDLDFIFFDADGDLSTSGDRIYPLENSMTYVTQGVFRKGAASPYQPTGMHPGKFFGLLADGSTDFATATLGIRDASYQTGYNLAPDTSHGWVSLGDGGQINVAFLPLSAGPGGSMYLFVGDVGASDEMVNASVELSLFVGATRIPFFNGNGPYSVYPGETMSLDGIPQDGMGDPIVSWKWDLDNDGFFDDATGPIVALPFEYFTQTLGMPLGLHTLGLQTVTAGGQGGTTTCNIILAPEPATIAMLAAGGWIAVFKRRSRNRKQPAR